MWSLHAPQNKIISRAGMERISFMVTNDFAAYFCTASSNVTLVALEYVKDLQSLLMFSELHNVAYICTFILGSTMAYIAYMVEQYYYF